jgi:hypothetical protein
MQQFKLSLASTIGFVSLIMALPWLMLIWGSWSYIREQEDGGCRTVSEQ